EGVPSYFADLGDRHPTRHTRGKALIISVTGKTLAAVRAPGGGRFVGLTPTADQRSFLLAARAPMPSTAPGRFTGNAPAAAARISFYWLTFSPATGHARLRPLP